MIAITHKAISSASSENEQKFCLLLSVVANLFWSHIPLIFIRNSVITSASSENGPTFLLVPTANLFWSHIRMIFITISVIKCASNEDV